MPCYAPLKGWRSNVASDSGKRRIVFKPQDAYTDLGTVTVPCGQCIGCRLTKSHNWAIRCMHEASLHEHNCFITLTFNDQHLNDKGTLVKRDMQLFIKRLRDRIKPIKIRYYHCGEYGDKNDRPHHHALIFGYDFPDKLFWRKRDDMKYYTSNQLDDLWRDPDTGQSLGYCVIGEVTFESAAYVARYVLKKQTGDGSKIYKDKGIIPPYTTMSRRPGIAREWIEKYHEDVYPHDYLVIKNGIKAKPPRYYDDFYADLDKEDMESIKEQRKKRAEENAHDNSDHRLMTKNKCRQSKVKLLKRTL